jgi:long-chain acyl-CoA synthetase
MGFHITLEALPRTPLGKIKRFIVREKYASKIAAEKSEAAVSKELTREDIAVLESETAGKIMGHLKKELKIKKEINLDDTLELDLGIDSLGRIELASALEGIFNIKVEGDVIGKAFTVKDLILGVEALLKGIERVPAGDKGEGAVRSADYWKSLFRVLPREENLKKINLKPGFWSWLAGAIFLLPIRAYFKAFCYFRVEGKDNVPEEGACILYANHASYFDGFLVACALPRSPRMDLFFVGFRPYFDVPIIRNLLRIGRIIPLDFSSHLLEALRSCYFVLKNGKKLCVFPEGLRSLDGKTGGFKKGFGILAKETGVRLVPVFLKGAYEAWPRTSKFPRPHPIKAIIGKAVLPDDLEKEGLGLGAEDSYAAICAAARQRLEELRSR